jgi:hypothetical protein
MGGTSGAQTAGRGVAPVRPRKCHHRRERRARWRSGPSASRVSGRRADRLMPAPPPNNVRKFRAPISAIAASQSRDVARRVENKHVGEVSWGVAQRAGPKARRVFAVSGARHRAFRWDARRILVSLATLRPQRGQREGRSARLARSGSHSGCGDPRAPSSQRDAPPSRSVPTFATAEHRRSRGSSLAGGKISTLDRHDDESLSDFPQRARVEAQSLAGAARLVVHVFGALGRVMGAGGLPRAPSPPASIASQREASSSSFWAMGLRRAGRAQTTQRSLELAGYKSFD